MILAGPGIILIIVCVIIIAWALTESIWFKGFDDDYD